MNTLITDRETVTKIRHDKKDDIRIAIVEDDPMYRSAIEYYLRKIPGNRLFSFSSGEDYLRHYHQLDPEILILDYRLNDIYQSDKMNGLDILHEIKAIKPETEIIFLSGQENLDVATAAIKGGASEYIFKDFNALAKLQNVVTRISLYVRLKREEINHAKWIIGFIAAIIIALMISYWSGLHLAGEIKMLLGSTAVAIIAYFIIMWKKKKTIPKQDPVISLGERPGIWLD